MTPENVTITVAGRPTKVVLVAESEVTRGRLVGALRREHVDSDGGLHERYDQDLTESELLEARARQAAEPEAQGLAAGLSPAQRARVLQAPSGTVVRVGGQGWARHGTLYLVGPSSTPVPRSLLQGPPEAAPPPQVETEVARAVPLLDALPGEVEPEATPPERAPATRRPPPRVHESAPLAEPPTTPPGSITVRVRGAAVEAEVVSSRVVANGAFAGWTRVVARLPGGAEAEYVGHGGTWLGSSERRAHRAQGRAG